MADAADDTQWHHLERFVIFSCCVFIANGEKVYDVE